MARHPLSAQVEPLVLMNCAFPFVSPTRPYQGGMGCRPCSIEPAGPWATWIVGVIFFSKVKSHRLRFRDKVRLADYFDRSGDERRGSLRLLS